MDGTGIKQQKQEQDDAASTHGCNCHAGNMFDDCLLTLGMHTTIGIL